MDIIQPTAPSVTDACGNTFEGVFKDRISAIGADGNGTVTYNFTYTDCKEKNYDWSYVYTVTADNFTPVATAFQAEKRVSTKAFGQPNFWLLATAGEKVRQDHVKGESSVTGSS